jgi:Large polyvalent protein associated domain 39/ADP-Ribosyltransferase in polyvalent proteins
MDKNAGPWNDYQSASDTAGPWDEYKAAPKPKPTRNLVDIGRDVAATALKGAIAVPEAAVGLADLVTGGRVGKLAEDIGVRFKDSRAVADDFNSDATKAARQEFQQAEGLMGKTAAALSNPSVIATTVGESIPSMFAGGALAKGIGLAAPALAGRAGLAAAGEGAMMAGSQAESIRQQTEDGLLTGKQAALAAGTGLAGGAIGALGARAGKALGVGDVDTMIAGGAQGVAREGMGLANRIGRGALAEGVLEELPQSLAETALGNIALDRNVTEGMDEAAVLGTLSGGLMGGAAGALSRPAPLAAAAGGPNLDQPVQEQPVQPEQPAPQGMGESLTGGIPGLMGNNTDPLRSVIQPSLLKPSQAMGIDPSAGPLSRAAASAVDSAPQAVAPAAAQVPMEQRSLDELRTALRSAQDPAIRKTIAAEIRKRRESMPDPLTQQSLLPESEPVRVPEAAQAVESRQEEPQAPEPQPAALGSPLTDSGASILGRGSDPLQSIIQGQNDAEREAVTPPEPAPVTPPADAASSQPVQAAAQPDAGALTKLNDGIPDLGRVLLDGYYANGGYPWESGWKQESGSSIAQDGAAIRKASDKYSAAGMKLRDAIRHAEIVGDAVPDEAYKRLADDAAGVIIQRNKIMKPVANQQVADAGKQQKDNEQRPDGWRKNAIKASRVAKQIGLDPKGKRLAQIVAEIDAKDVGQPGMSAEEFRALSDEQKNANKDLASVDSRVKEIEGFKPLNPRTLQKQVEDLKELVKEKGRLLEAGATQAGADLVNRLRANVQDAPSQPTRTEAQAAPVEARAAEGGNAAAAGGVPAAGDKAGVQQGGVSEGRFIRLATNAERKGSKPKQDAMVRLSDELGREVVFKPFGSRGAGFYEAAPGAGGVQADGVAVSQPKPEKQPEPSNGAGSVSQPTVYTKSDAQAAERQVAQMIEDRIDAMQAQAVQKIAAKFLPSMGVKAPVGKAKIKAAVTDFTKINPLAAASEFGVEVAESVRKPLDAQFEGRLAEDMETVDSTTLTISMGGSEVDVDLGKPAWKATPDEVKNAVASAGYSSESRGKYDPMRQWYEAHSKAIEKAVKAGRSFPDEVLYERRGLIRSDLNDEQADEAADAMVDEFRKTGSYKKAVQVYRNFGKQTAIPQPEAEPLAVEKPQAQEQAEETPAEKWAAMPLADRAAMLDRYFGAGQTDAGQRYATRTWDSFNAGEKSTLAAAMQGDKANDRDTFTLNRLNRETDQMEPVTFKRGEYVRYTLSGKELFGEIDGISQARREFSVEGLWYPMGYAYKAERPAKKEQPTEKLSKVIEKVNAKNGEGLTEADRVPEAKPATKTPTVDRHMVVMESIRSGTGSLSDYKESFAAMESSEEAIKAELGAKTKDELLKAGGPYFYMRFKNETKPEIIRVFYKDLLAEYALGKSYGSSGFVMSSGGWAAHEKRQHEALKALVEAQTDEDLKTYAAEVAARREEIKAKREAKKSAMENPQTLEDFRAVMREHITDGKTRGEAFLMLTPEQRVKYDELEAESTKEDRETRKRAARTEVKAAGQTTGGQIIATKHTKTGVDLFVVQLADRLSKEDYNTILASAKKFGGWYSSFRGNGAVPGFHFKTRDGADAFLKLAAGDTTAAAEQAQQRRDAFDDDRSQTAVERLREMAEKIEDRASEDLSRERKTNTARRARFAAAAERAAEAEKALSRTMRNIAQAIEDGKAKFLDGVRMKTQVEALTGYVRTAKDNELRAKFPAYADQEKRKGEPPTSETADFAEFPAFTAYRSDLASLARQMLEVEGTKKLGAQLMKVADDVTDAYIDFAKKPENLLQLSTFSMKRGDEVKTAIFASRDLAERAIKRSGLTGKAIVLAEKRGVNRIIMSPSEAMNRKIWTGDGDKRITLTAEYGNELVEAIGRRGNKRNGLAVPWQFQTAYDRRKALSRMGVETPAEFRSALREFIALQERATANKVREMELSMAGKKNDGLDFFPTPQDVADQMVEAADIKPDMAVLEPSAGMGHIADRINDSGVSPDVVEMAEDRRELLTEKGYELVGRDFLELEGKQYDRIVMNPPFSNRRDAEHVKHAYSLLKPGGRIVAIMGEGVFFGSDKKAQDFREWLESVGGTDEKLPAGSFMDPSLPVNTGVNARMVVIDKPEGDAAQAEDEANFGDAETPPFYSALAKEIENLNIKSAPFLGWHGQLQGLVRAGKVKADELEWTGITEWLKLQTGKVSKEDVIAYLDANGVQVTETVLGAQQEQQDDKSEQAQLKRQLEAAGYVPETDPTGEFIGVVRQSDDGFFMYEGKRWIEEDGERELDADIASMATRYGELFDKEAELQSRYDYRPPKYSQYTLPGGPLSRDTEILSRDGWVRMDEVQVGDLVMTRRDEDGRLEWQEVEAVPTVFADKLYHFKSQSINMRVTACHNMLVKRRRRSSVGLFRAKAADLWGMSECVAPLVGDWRGEATVDLYGYRPEDAAELIGWYIAEGSAITENGKKSTLAISQSRAANPEKCARIEALLERMKISWNYVASGPAYYLSIKTMDRGLVDVLHAQGDSRNKFVPGFMFDQPPSVLSRLMDGLLLGDGCLANVDHPTRKPRWAYHSNCKQLADDMQLLALLTGKRAVISQRPTGLYEVHLNSKQWASIDDAKHGIVDYNDTAYCVTVKNHAIYVRTGGVAAFTGNSNYREVLLTLPTKDADKLARANDLNRLAGVAGTPGTERVRLLQERDRLREEAGNGQKYKSSHWDQPNVLAHIRVNDRTDADGKRVLFVEEIQSDWGQDGKKKGFAGEKVMPAGWSVVERQAGGWIVKDQNGDMQAWGDTREAAEQNAISANYELTAGVPRAPFIDKTDKWLALALKRVMKMAVDGGYDRVAFVTGEQSAERYDLSKQISKVTYSSAGVLRAYNLNGDRVINQKTEKEKLQDVIGKDAAEKLLAAPITNETNSGVTYPVQELSGLDLKVGGEGMKAFYDRIVPAAVKDVLKKVGGGAMEAVQINGTATYDQLIEAAKRTGKTQAELDAMPVSERKALIDALLPSQTGFTITDSMREKVAGGLPLFAGSKAKKRGEASQVDRAVMDMAGEGRDANDILKVIADTSKSPFRRQLAKRLIATGANPAVSLGGDMGGGEGFKFLAKYSRKNHEVTLSEAAADRAEQIFLHETTHAATLMALDRGGQYADQMKTLYEQVKKQGKVSGYGMKNVGEFVAEAFTNPEFQKALKGTPVLGRSAWQRFVTMVRRILGMDVGAQNALEQALELGVGVMRENVELRKARSFRAEDGPAFAGVDQTETEAFRKWFGDSKVVDAQGKPLVVYHGTAADFSAFNKDQGGRAQYFGDGIYLTSDKNQASMYAGRGEGSNVMPVYAALKNPFIEGVSKFNGGKTLVATELRKDLIQKRYEKAGFDGVILQRGWVVAFRPEQIKSATGNRGTFDPNNPDIANFGISEAVDQIKAFDVKTAPKNTWAHYRGMALQALGRRQLVDLYAEELPQLETYNELVQQMDAEKNDTGAEADRVAQDWGSLKAGMDRKLAELMHDATLAKMDPDKPMPAGYNKREYDDLKTRFNALSPEAQALYRKARDMYMDHYKAVQQAIKERIERSEMSEGQKRKLMADLDGKLFKELKGVYFPLARFGQYVIVVKNANGEVVNVTRAETVKEAETVRKELQKAFPAHMGNSVGKVLKQAEFNAGRDAVGKGFMADLMGALDEKGVDDELRDTVAQLYLSSLPDLSWAKHGIHRKGTPGFSQDARRAFAQNMFHGARYLAKLRHADQLQDLLIEMQDHIKAYEGVEEYDSIQAQQVVDEMVKRHEILMNPKASPVSTALTSFGFLFHMGLSPASAMVNLTQTALVAYPQMGAKWGFDKAGAALLKASDETVRAKNDLASRLKGDELDAFNRAVKDGTIDVTMAHDLAGIAQGEDQGVMWKVRPVMRWASFMFHHAEKFNRQATFLAAYRLAKEAGPNKSADQLYEEAKRATYDGHFDYSASNRARAMQGNWQRVILLFKNYAQHMVYALSRNAYQSLKAIDPKERALARKTLGGILATHAAAAGVLGLPIVGPLLTVASWIGGDDDEPWDAEVAMQNAMAEMIGPKPAEVIARGFSRLTPWDLSGRVALNKLILPDVQEGLEGKEWAESAMAAALGPVAGIGVNVARGVQKMTEGDYMRGLEDMMPTALRGPLKAIRYADEGAVDKTGVVITDEVSVAGVVGQASGFAPSQVRRDTERRSAIYGYDRKLLERRSVLMRMFAEARIAGDEETARAVQEDIQAFNQKNPSRRITPMNLAASIRNRRKRVQEAEQGVYLPSKRRDALEAVSF